MENTTVKNKNLYNITPEMRKTAREKLARIIKEQNVKVAETREDLYGFDEGQSQEEIQAEVDEFLRMKNEWRESDRKLLLEREETA